MTSVLFAGGPLNGQVHEVDITGPVNGPVRSWWARPWKPRHNAVVAYHLAVMDLCGCTITIGYLGTGTDPAVLFDVLASPAAKAAAGAAAPGYFPRHRTGQATLEEEAKP